MSGRTLVGGLVWGALWASVAGLSLTQSALAGNWTFEVSNKSSIVVSSFLTQEEGAWSKNWLNGQRINPGDIYEMDFGTDEGECVVRTRIAFSDKSYFDEDINYCEVEKIHLFNTTLTTE